MTDLPAPLADPLHILEPGPWRKVLVVTVLAAVVFWLFWLWVRRRLAARSEPSPPPVAPSLGAFAEAIEAIRRRTGESQRFRHGCHELAELLRGRLRTRHGDGLAYLTALEIEARLEGDAGAELLVEVSATRFARRPPNTRLFDGLCDRALELDRKGWRS